MSKHTPGPWFVDGHEVYSHDTTHADCTIRIADSTTLGESKHANARLISSAPDLLAAAKHALTVLRGSGFTDTTPMMSQLINAIEKAET